MAEMKWTKAQEQVIKARKRNLLVSAAAGSGKTAVLVERIIQMVTDPVGPVDIDRLLVMTFTNAAAAEMRERIGDALEKKLEQNPGDRNLERQATLIHHAKITTIDSFCLYLLREHFNELDIDPGFRIGDEGELLLLQADVMKELLEDYYGRNDETFFRFVDTYASGKADGGLEDYIMQVYRFSQSNPWPGAWFEECRREICGEDAKNPGSFEKSRWMGFLISDVKRQAGEFAGLLCEALEIAGEEDGPQVYIPMLTEDKENMERLAAAESYGEIYEILANLNFGRLAAARGKQVDPEKKDMASGIRNQVKDAVKKMKELYVPGEMDDMFSDMQACQELVLMLLELAEEFEKRFGAAKRDKNLVDFNDLEHFALEILTGGSASHEPGPVADELAKFYEEILVDEYQDSNEVQEALIRAVSGERFGRPNVFMVGDVKQSIYKFRLAKPKLFLDKYISYSKEESSHQKIELDQNFRSRPEVLSSVNDMFFSIMTEALGGITYTEEAALHVGADYPEAEVEGQMKTEVYLLNTGEELISAMDEEKADYTAKEAEARLIAMKIRELTDPETGMKIWTRKTEQYEPLKKKDIVILLRSLSGWTEEFLSVLSSEGIPAFAESRTGYFNAIEVENVLNMLAILDNPMQDIPLVGVLKSPIGGFSDRELAMIMAAFKKNLEKGQDAGFYGAVKAYVNSHAGESDEICEKLLAFLSMLTELREEAGYLPVHRLLHRIFERTGYYDYVSAMPAGQVRQANLDMLVEKAAAFEKTSYQSLFDFIRYIEKLKKYDTDFGEAARAGENEDTVRIMSIHKSKGLEFPVVFLAGAGKQFNRQDTRGRILIDEELGIATDYFDVDMKVKAPTLKKNVLSRRSNLETMGEELRILYVAMTRAREKLIITAGDKYLGNRLEKWSRPQAAAGTGAGLPFTALSAANSYLDWILMAASNTGKSMEIMQVPIAELVDAETKAQEEKAETFLKLKALREAGFDGVGFGGAESGGAESGGAKIGGAESDNAGFDSLLHFVYPHQADITLHAKMSVSELKHQGQFQDDAESAYLVHGLDRGGSSTVNKGALRGTAYHRALELLDFKGISERKDLFHQMKEFEESKRMNQDSLDMIRNDHIWKFFESDIAGRMRTADVSGNLHKESQFIMGIPARMMDEADSDEPILIQGIIDAWFEEDGELVLVDYKTDRVREEDGEQVLKDRYQIQMLYYAQALQQITEKKVKEAVLYSLTLQREIRVPILL